MKTAQQHAIWAIDLLVERMIFEYVLRGPVTYSALIDHLTYALYGRTDAVAKQLTAQAIQHILEQMQNTNAIAISQVGDQWFVYNIPAQPTAETTGAVT